MIFTSHLRKIVVPLGFLGLAVSGTVHSATLYDVYELALENDPVYEIGRYEKEASSEVYAQARALLLPQASVEINRSIIQQNILDSDNTVFASGRTTYPQSEATFSLTQSVFDWSRWQGFAQAKLEVKRLAIELDTLRQDLAERVVDRYFAVLASEAALDHVYAERKSVQKQLDLTKARFDQGLARKTEFQDSEARALEIEARELELRNQRDDSVLALSEVIGKVPSSLATVVNNLPLTRPDPDSADKWVEMALAQNLELSVKEYEIQEARKEILIAKSGHLPTIDLNLDVNKRDTGGTLFGGGSDVRTDEINLTVSIPIFSGGAVNSNIRAAIKSHSRTKVEMALLRRQVERDTRSAYNNVVKAITKVESFRKLLDATEGLVESKKLAYESGLATNLEVLDAERDLFFARSEHALARYEYITSLLALKKFSGSLNQDDIKQISDVMLSGNRAVTYHQGVPLQIDDSIAAEKL